MARIFRDDERGAAPAYTIGLVVLAILLIGGVLLLKGTSDGKGSVDKPVTVETGEFKDDEAKTDDKSKTDTTTSDDKKSDEGTTTTTVSRPNTPDKITATGPMEDFLVATVGLILASGTMYMAFNYAKSRSTIKAKLLQK